MLWWLGLLGCSSSSQVDALERELADAKAQIEALEVRIAALDGSRAGGDPVTLTGAEREEARRLAGTDGAIEPVDPPARPDLTPRQALTDLEYASQQARALLHRGRDDAFDGFRLSAVRRGSLPDRIGLANGDIVNKVNGMPLTSMEQAMEVYAAATDPGCEELILSVTRRGAPIEFRVPLDEVLPPPAPNPFEAVE